MDGEAVTFEVKRLQQPYFSDEKRLAYRDVGSLSGMVPDFILTSSSR